MINVMSEAACLLTYPLDKVRQPFKAIMSAYVITAFSRKKSGKLLSVHKCAVERCFSSVYDRTEIRGTRFARPILSGAHAISHLSFCALRQCKIAAFNIFSRCGTCAPRNCSITNATCNYIRTVIRHLILLFSDLELHRREKK